MADEALTEHDRLIIEATAARVVEIIIPKLRGMVNKAFSYDNILTAIERTANAQASAAGAYASTLGKELKAARSQIRKAKQDDKNEGAGAGE